MLSRLFFSITGCLAVLCFLVAFYVAAEHTSHYFANHNYFFSPFADDILDNSRTTYPIALGQQSFWSIFSPYIDHRVAVEHVQELIDFYWTSGVQVLQPYRISILLWANFLIFFQYIIRPSLFSIVVKTFLCGAYLFLLFASMSVNTYVSTMQITWPILFLFTLLTFVNLSRYCQNEKNNESSKKSYGYIALTLFCLNIVLYTFNIGIVLWPIIFLILIQQRCLKRHAYVWIGFAFINYYIYLEHHWVMNNFHSHASQAKLFSIPAFLEIYNNYSRILSVPFNIHAFYQNIWISKLVGFISIFISIAYIVSFVSNRNRSFSDITFFGYFLFSMLAMIAISVMRCAVDWRFLTAGLFFDFCLLMSLFMMLADYPRLRRSVLTYFSLVLIGSVWLLFGFLPNDKLLSNGTYELGFFNQVFISEATSIPINENFMKASKIYQSSGALQPHVFINEINKSQRKGPYSFWVSQYMNRSIKVLQNNKQILAEKARIYVAYDYRPERSPGLLINVSVKNSDTLMNNQWQIVFTKKDGTIVGFGISGPYLQPLWVLLMRPSHFILWRGAINTQSLKPQDTITAWAIDQNHDVIYQLGNMIIPSPLYSQKQVTWVWQKTQHFGVE